MLKKLRGSKETNNSMLTLALEINEQNKIHGIKFGSKRETRLFNLAKRDTVLRSENIVNGQTKPKSSPLTKPFKEDLKENIQTNVPVKQIEFYDQMNKKKVSFNYWDEKLLSFPKNTILPSVKYMKVDNDVMTDSEQRQDALSMMRSNLKETIKLIRQDKDYLAKNMSKKIKVKKC